MFDISSLASRSLGIARHVSVLGVCVQLILAAYNKHFVVFILLIIYRLLFVIVGF